MYIAIHNTGDQPIYEQVFSQIKEHILTGKLKEGEALPSMRLLAKELRISVITTKRAYEELEAAGYIVSIPGKGSFVAPQNTELLREEHLRQTEEHLRRAIETSRLSGLSLLQLTEFLTFLYEEEGK